MKWVDYREKLGIGFSDSQKFKMLSAMLKNHIEKNDIKATYKKGLHWKYCQMVGEDYYDDNYTYSHLKNSLDKCKSIDELVAKYIAMYNIYPVRIINYPDGAVKELILECLKESLEKLNINYKIIKDGDGIFIFPSGAKELDDALVSEPLEWLSDYPNTRKTFTIALQQYSNGQYIRDVADNLRKAFEEFLKEFLNNNKNLKNNNKEVEVYLREQSADLQLIKMLSSLISHYYLLNNEVAKHNDKMDAKYLEFLMYQTGIFIRMLIVVKNDSEKV